MSRRLVYLIFTTILLLSICAFAQSVPLAQQTPRQINDSDRVVLKGNVHPFANAQFRIGTTDPSLSMDKMVLVLARRPGVEAELNVLIAQQHNPKSPLFHKWLTPEEFGRRFGITDQDLQSVVQWLESYGFRVDEIAKGRGWINFSGTADQVQRAFTTEMDDFMVNGRLHHANRTEPSIPRALSDIVPGVLTLHNFLKQPASRIIRRLDTQGISPEFTSGSNHYLSPGDFATIYNVKPLYSASIDGTGQTIAIVGRTDINLSDVTSFRNQFGLPTNNPQFIHNGTDPGDLGGGEEGEADLDVQWSGAIARNATVKFVISASTNTTDGVDLSAQYIVNNNVAPVMSTSFGQCESVMGTTENAFYNNLWSQAASQGITSFVSSGDNGAAGCDSPSNSRATGGRAVSGLATTPFNVAVGGGQFNEGSNPGTYWSSSNASDGSSALSYIPEVVWNESGSNGGSGLWSSSGGVSSIYAKPSWQVSPGVPSDSKRDIPDVSFSAASHDGYIVAQGGSLFVVGGTSASSPSFASVMALVVQKTGQRQGNANTVFYPMAQSQYGGSGPAVFHDITSGNNTVPGVTGYSAGTGYDLATGLGSVDVNALVNNWGGTTSPDFAVSTSPTSPSIAAGASGSVTITTTVSGGFNSAVSLNPTGQPSGVTVSFNPASIAAPGSGSSTMTVAVGSSVAAGSYPITVTATGGSTTHTATVTLVVTVSGGSQLLGNPGFENGSNAAPWVATSGVIDNSTGEAPHSGSWKAWLDGYGRTHTDTLYQQVTIPSTATKATLTFWLHIDTAETTTTAANDKLLVQIRNSSNTVLSTLATYSNLNKGTGYTQKSFDITSFKGQTIRVYFSGTENNSRQTSFVIDDTALNIQ